MSFVHADVVPGYRRSPADLDHVVNPDPELRASATGPVRVCLTCGERIKPKPQRTDIVGGILRFLPQAVVETRQFDGGINYEVRVPGHRIVRYSVEWGDDEAQALQVILRAISESRYESQ